MKSSNQCLVITVLRSGKFSNIVTKATSMTNCGTFRSDFLIILLRHSRMLIRIGCMNIICLLLKLLIVIPGTSDAQNFIFQKPKTNIFNYYRSDLSQPMSCHAPPIKSPHHMRKSSYNSQIFLLIEQ